MINKQAGVLGRGLLDVAPSSKRIEISSLLQPDSTAVKTSPLFSPLHPFTVCIASGKGGTGKTFFAANLALALAQQGKKVLLFDADLGLGNAHLHLGLNPHSHVGHFLRGEKKLGEILLTDSNHISFLPGGSGVSELANLTLEQWSRLVAGLKELCGRFDVVLMDLPAGIGGQVLRFLRVTRSVVLVTTPEIPSMMDAYALVKTIKKQQIPVSLNIVINRVHDKMVAGELLQKMSQMMAFHLKGTVAQWLGFIPEDKDVEISIRKRAPLLLLYPASSTANQIEKITTRLNNREKEKTCIPSPSPIKREVPEKQPQPST